MKKMVIAQGNVWEFYAHEGFLKCFNPQTKENETIISCEDCEFDVTVKSNNLIFLLVKGKENLFVARYNGKWESESILKYKKENSYIKNISLIENAGWLNGFYIIKSNNKNLLVHHIMPSEGKPKIIYASDNDFSFCLSTDYKQNIYVAIYEEREISFRKYYWNIKKWDENIIRQNSEYNIVNMNFVADKEEAYHICYCGERDNRFFVVAKESILMSDLIKPVVPILFFKDNELLCAFNYYGKLLSSTYNGNEFGKLQYFHINGFKDCEVVKLSTTREFNNQRNFLYTYAYENKDKILCNAFCDEEEYLKHILNTRGKSTVDNVENFANKNQI